MADNKFLVSKIIAQSLLDLHMQDASFFTIANKDFEGDFVNNRYIKGSTINVEMPTYPSAVQGQDLSTETDAISIKGTRMVPIIINETTGMNNVLREFTITEETLKMNPAKYKTMIMEPLYRVMRAAHQKVAYDIIATNTYRALLEKDAVPFHLFGRDTIIQLDRYIAEHKLTAKCTIFAPPIVLAALRQNEITGSTVFTPIQNEKLMNKKKVTNYMDYDFVQTPEIRLHVSGTATNLVMKKSTSADFVETSDNTTGTIRLACSNAGGTLKKGDLLVINQENFSRLDLIEKEPTNDYFTMKVMEDTAFATADALYPVKIAGVPIPYDSASYTKTTNESANIRATASDLKNKPVYLVPNHYKCFAIAAQGLTMINPRLKDLEVADHYNAYDKESKTSLSVTYLGDPKRYTNLLRVTSLLGGGVFGDQLIEIPVLAGGMSPQSETEEKKIKNNV